MKHSQYKRATYRFQGKKEKARRKKEGKWKEKKMKKNTLRERKRFGWKKKTQWVGHVLVVFCSCFRVHLMMVAIPIIKHNFLQPLNSSLQKKYPDDQLLRVRLCCSDLSRQWKLEKKTDINKKKQFPHRTVGVALCRKLFFLLAFFFPFMKLICLTYSFLFFSHILLYSYNYFKASVYFNWVYPAINIE